MLAVNHTNIEQLSTKTGAEINQGLLKKVTSGLVGLAMLGTLNTQVFRDEITDMSTQQIIENISADELVTLLSGKETAFIAGAGLFYYGYTNGLFDGLELPSAQIAGQSEESITASIENTSVYENDIYIPLTVVSRVGVQVRENEAGLFDFIPLVEGGPSWGTQKVDLYGVGDVDIAIDGRIQIFRDDTDKEVIHVNISPFRTWRPALRMETLVFNPDGDEMSGLIGEPSTRDRATNAALVAMQTLVANEGCRAANEALITEEAIIPVIEDQINNQSLISDLNYDPLVDTIKVHISKPPEETADYVTAEEFRTFYTTDQEGENILRRPQLGENEALRLLEILSDEVDNFWVVDGAGESLSIEQLKDRREFCEQNILGEVVEIEIYQGDVFIGDKDNLIEDGQDE